MVRFTDDGGEPSDEGLAPVIPLFGGPIAEPDIERAGRVAQDQTPRRRVVSDPVVEQAKRDDAPSATFSEDYWLDEQPAADEPARASTDDVDEPADRERLHENAVTSLTRSLGRRGLSVSEAQARLRADGLTAEESQDVVDEFIERGWLDDAVLAEQLVHSATTRKGMGTRAIRQLLIKRSVAREVIDPGPFRFAEIHGLHRSPSEQGHVAGLIRKCGLTPARCEFALERIPLIRFSSVDRLPARVGTTPRPERGSP